MFASPAPAIFLEVRNCMIVLGILHMSIYQDDPSVVDDYSVFLTQIGFYYMSYRLDIIDKIDNQTIGDTGAGPVIFDGLFGIALEMQKYETV